jgi:DNA polymerase I-like protein with 3'-5' exonuclease and polymerase domains
MALQEITKNLFGFVQNSKIIFLSWDPASFDSTTLAKLFIRIKFTNTKGETQTLPVSPSNAVLVSNILKRINEQKKLVVVGHNFKILFTLFKRLTSKTIPLQNLFDLGWYESYYSLPSSLNNPSLMTSHLKKWFADEYAIKIYKNIFFKLITQTLPNIESVGLVNVNLGLLVFPNFVVEGQANGRLSCVCEYKRCYNPHSLSDEEKQELNLYSSDEFFVWFDYRNMEVSVLAELANDEFLKKIIIGNPMTVYEKIFEIATGTTNPDARRIAKQMFLPCIYGQAQNGLAKSLDISVDQAAIYLHNLRDKFSKSFEYVEKFQQIAAETNTATDAFGRIRRFEQDDSFKARNFAVQAPSALLCLEALVRLESACNGNFEVIFTVHDGYVISAKKPVLEEAYKLAKKCLQETSDLIPIELNVSTKIGRNLAKMQNIGRR